MKNFWAGFAIAAIVAVIAVYAVRLTSPSLETKGLAATRFLVHIYETNGSCAAALVGPKRADAKERADVTWEPRIDCTGMKVVSMDITNFRQKSATACEHDQSSGNPGDSPVEDLADGPNGSKRTRVKPGAAQGHSHLPYCYDVTVRITGEGGDRSIKADPEMDIMP